MASNDNNPAGGSSNHEDEDLELQLALAMSMSEAEASEAYKSPDHALACAHDRP
jgi:hypothetical protein